MEAIILSMAGGVAGFGLGMVVSFIFGRISDIEFIVSGISILWTLRITGRRYFLWLLPRKPGSPA